MTVKSCTIAGCLAAVTAYAPAQAVAADKDWRVETGAGLAHYDNFFLTGDTATPPAQDATETRLYLDAEREFSSGAWRWALFGGAALVQNHDIDDADTEEFRLGASARYGSTRVALEFEHLPNIIFSEEGTGTFYDLDTLTLDLRQTLTERVTASLSYDWKQQEFDADEPLRDADVDDLQGTLRIKLNDMAALRLLAGYARKDARGDANSWETTAFGVALELSPAERWEVFARARLRAREYDKAAPGDSNFGRDDDILDALVNARYRIGERWGVRGQLEYRDAESTRADRNYDAFTFSLAVFAVF